MSSNGGGISGPGPWVSRMKTQITLLTGTTSGNTKILDANPNRYYLGFDVGAATTTVVVCPSRAAINKEGFLVSSQLPPVQFFFAQHGELVQEPWFAGAYMVQSGFAIIVVEGLWLPEVQ